MGIKKITKIEYQKAESLIAKYKIQINRELLQKSYVCVCCRDNTIKPLDINFDNQ